LKLGIEPATAQCLNQLRHRPPHAGGTTPQHHNTTTHVNNTSWTVFSALANMSHSPASISQIISALRSISNALITQQPDDTLQDGHYLRRLLHGAAQIKLETAGK